ncbi:MAG: hypothetical protein KKG33_09595 [candidate division Zixibacteria bacterium]|nr:hypothetical protein [candidate division Zixibacteria bacterium]MBU1471327.1 hypothetical protein [candidate division Zixibacteria bacterium]MBU2625800.1 hypothetical protein [candidate division Zixibacteria bacterium]
MLIDIERHTRRMIGLLGIATLFGILFVPISSAQVSSNAERELEITERLIDRAADAVREAGSVIGYQHLERAVELQRGARDAYREGTHRRASTLTLMAREQAKKAIGAIQMSDENSSLVSREIERTDDVLKKAHDQVRESNDQNAVSLLERASKTQTDGKEFFRGNRLKIALKATLKARDTAKKAIEIAGRQPNQTNRLRREIDRTDDLIAKALERATQLESNGQVHMLLENARASQLIARERFESGDHQSALNQTTRARDVAKQALAKMETDVQPERIEKLLQQNDRLIENLRDRLHDSPNANASELIDVAVGHQSRAKEALSSGKHNVSIVEAKAARDLAERARDMMEK